MTDHSRNPKPETRNLALPAAVWSFTARADIAWNAACIRRGLSQAVRAGAKVLLTPECALVGYPSAARADLAGIDWCQVAELEDTLLLEAERAGILLVLGTASADGDGGFTNDAVAGGCVQPVRYRKRCLTGIDQQHFRCGSVPTVVEAHGWRFGLGICFDLRFDDIWADLARAGCDAFLVIAHMAGPDPDHGIKAAVIPAFCTVRAAAWATPLLFANTATSDRWLDSGAWDARGLRIAAGEMVDDGSLLTVGLHSRAHHDPWYAGLRDRHLDRETRP